MRSERTGEGVTHAATMVVPVAGPSTMTSSLSAVPRWCSSYHYNRFGIRHETHGGCGGELLAVGSGDSDRRQPRTEIRRGVASVNRLSFPLKPLLYVVRCRPINRLCWSRHHCRRSFVRTFSNTVRVKLQRQYGRFFPVEYVSQIVEAF